jgi:hypothetical protein
VDEPVHSTKAAGRTVWWKWHADATGPVSLDTEGSSIAALLAVYSGPGYGSLHRIAQALLVPQNAKKELQRNSFFGNLLLTILKLITIS